MNAILDTGANISCISEDIFKRFKLHLITNSAISFQQVSSKSKSLGRLKLKLEIGRMTKEVEAHVIRGLNEDSILGLDLAKYYEIEVDIGRHLLFQGNHCLSDPADEQKRQAKGNDTVGEANFAAQQNTYFQQRFEGMLEEYRTLFSSGKTGIGRVTMTEHRIILNNNTPIRLKPYRTSCKDNEEIRMQISQLMKAGLIQESLSPFSFPVTLVKKKGEGRTRMCIDYRKINAVTAPDYEPIPRIDDILDVLADAKIFTTLDIALGYWHVAMHLDDIQKTAFTVQEGHFEWKVMPFGLKNAPATFQRTIKMIIQKHRLRNTLNYFDDIIIFSKNEEEHLRDVENTFRALIEENIKLKKKKCQFALREINFLSYTIRNNQILPNQTNIESIIKFPVPKDIKNLQRFLGLVNVYNRFIDKYADRAKPLTDLLKLKHQWNWNSECQKSFDDLKNSLITSPILSIYSPHLPCILYTDASSTGIGGVLKQKREDGEHPVSYFSRKLHQHELNYSVTELECLALVECVDKWNVYLNGSPFTIVTEHAALQWLKPIKKPTGRLFRWSLKLSMYEYQIKYRKSKENVEADALSRVSFMMFDKKEIMRAQSNITKIRKPLTTSQGLIIYKKGNSSKIFLPKELREVAIRKAHEHFGHPGARKTTSIIALEYFWSGCQRTY